MIAATTAKNLSCSRVNLPIGLGTGLGEGFQKAAAVGIVFEDGFAPVAAIDEVVNCAWVFDADFAGHA
jgi:hypothetical protein